MFALANKSHTVPHVTSTKPQLKEMIQAPIVAVLDVNVTAGTIKDTTPTEITLKDATRLLVGDYLTAKNGAKIIDSMTLKITKKVDNTKVEVVRVDGGDFALVK